MAAVVVLGMTIGLPLLAAMWLHKTFKLNELRQRQILAMIEKGIAPPPELNPASLDRLAGVRRRSRREERFKSGGIMLVGLGVALALIIGIAGGQPRVGLGVGGAVAAIGVAMIVSALTSRGDADTESPPAGGSGEPPPAVEPPRSERGVDAGR
jgi:hypothetical protein